MKAKYKAHDNQSITEKPNFDYQRARIGRIYGEVIWNKLINIFITIIMGDDGRPNPFLKL